MTSLRVLIVAADPLARAGLAALLAGEPDVAVAGQAGAPRDPAELDAALAAFVPDVVLWDVGWSADAPTLDALGALAEQGRPLVVLLGDADLLPDLWAAGARSVVGRAADGARLAAGLAAALAGLAVIEPDYLPALPAPVTARGAPADPPLEELTPRELDVLRALAEGLPNKLIARELGISEHTVKYHVNSILGKLGASSRTDAVVRATRAGLLLL